MRYLVLSPTYTSGGSYDPPEPPEEGRDMLVVDAPTASAAKVAAVREWRKRGACRFYATADSHENPFKGLTAEPLRAEENDPKIWHELWVDK